MRVRPGRRVHGSGGGLVLRVHLAKAADPAHGCHALLMVDEAAIVGGIAHIQHRAPRIILRLRAGVYPGCRGEHCEREKDDSHGGSPGICV